MSSNFPPQGWHVQASLALLAKHQELGQPCHNSLHALTCVLPSSIHSVLLVCSYSISQQLSKVKHLAHLTLGPPPTAVYRGGLEHLPALRAFAGRGAGAGSADLVSSAVTRLTTCSAHVRHHPHLCIACTRGIG